MYRVTIRPSPIGSFLHPSITYPPQKPMKLYTVELRTAGIGIPVASGLTPIEVREYIDGRIAALTRDAVSYEVNRYLTRTSLYIVERDGSKSAYVWEVR